MRRRFHSAVSSSLEEPWSRPPDPNFVGFDLYPLGFRVLLGGDEGVEIGAGWKHVGECAGDYVSVQPDSPFCPRPLRANLFRSGDDMLLGDCTDRGPPSRARRTDQCAPRIDRRDTGAAR
ncbi:hypothetical protein GCM10010837_47980 [Aminobacter niigataensis]